MDMTHYQRQARSTAIYPGSGELLGLTYAVLGLTNEAGEVAGKLKKNIRDENGQMSTERAEELAAELGDVLWYVAQVASELGYSLSGVAERNLDKLQDRARRGVIGGSGDMR